MSVVDDLTWHLDKADNAIASIIFAHGAGAGFDSEFMQIVTNGLVAKGINVYRFNFPYMQQRALDGKRRPPNRMPALEQSFAERLAKYNDDLPLFVAGKSMGSRVAALVSNDEKVHGVIALGYPFHPPKKLEKTRLEPLLQTTKPVLILQGDRDALGNKQDIDGYQLPKTIELQFFADGDHDLKPRVRSGHSHQQHLAQAISSMVQFLEQHS
ncbi:alpha/beta family hydrolase [Thalassotalea sp. Y01]|uniref:alpha/beta family hydrolase n=1 Tax=Thalassotalea sp. Y01 TaxID=2729613 RepID=UPI001B7D4C07|nr:alpha/beta family hydrolase [Thalassotalea sp. Y01]